MNRNTHKKRCSKGHKKWRNGMNRKKNLKFSEEDSSSDEEEEERLREKNKLISN